MIGFFLVILIHRLAGGSGDAEDSNQSDEEKHRMALSLEAQRTELIKLQEDVAREHCRLSALPSLSNISNSAGKRKYGLTKVIVRLRVRQVHFTHLPPLIFCCLFGYR